MILERMNTNTLQRQRKRENDRKQLRQLDEPVQGRPPLVLSKKAVARELTVCLRTVDSLIATKNWDASASDGAF